MLESNRLLMLRYINEVEAEAGYIDLMTAFAESEFEEVCGEFANAVPITAVTRSAVEALKRMIGRESVGATLTSAITKLMVVHGTDFDRRDPMYKSIFLALMSADLMKGSRVSNSWSGTGRLTMWNKEPSKRFALAGYSWIACV
jgi:hypothetical protein